MKTAVSLPDDLFEAAEKAAQRLGVSRSRLYARAIAAYLEGEGAEAITEKLNEVYAEQPTGLDPVLESMQSASVLEEGW